MIKFTKYGAALLLGAFMGVAESTAVESGILQQLAATGRVDWESIQTSNPDWCQRKVDGFSDSSPDGWGTELDEQGIVKDWYWHMLGGEVSGNNLSWHRGKVAALTAKNLENLVVFRNWYMQNKARITVPMAVGLFDSFSSFPCDSRASAMILEWLSSEPVSGFIVNSMFREPTEDECQHHPMGNAENYLALAGGHSINATFSCGYVFRLLAGIDREKLPSVLTEGTRLLVGASGNYYSFKFYWENYIDGLVGPYRKEKRIIQELSERAGLPSGIGHSGWEERSIQSLCANNPDNLTAFRNWYNSNKRNITPSLAHSLLICDFGGFPRSDQATSMILNWLSEDAVRHLIRVASFRDYTQDEYYDDSGHAWADYNAAAQAYERKEGFTCGYVFCLLANVDLKNLPLVLAEGRKLLLANPSRVDYGPFKDAWEAYVNSFVPSL